MGWSRHGTSVTRQAGEKTVMKSLIARFIREEEGQDIIE
jgi:hypothetical protein